jgi:SAM-dependent methyltransferase
MNRRELLALAALAASGLARAQAAPAFSAADLQHAARLRDLGLADGTAWALVQQLCNEVGARPAGSAGDAKATAWAQAAMRRLGLQNVRAESTPLRVWQRGPAAARLVSPQALPLVMAALGNSVAAPEGGIEADVAWYADFEALKTDTSDRARGKIVFIDQKTERFKDGRGYGAAVVARAQGPIEAAKRGALALAIRSIGTDNDPIAHTGATRYEIGVPRIPAFAISMPDANRLAALQAEGKTLRLQFTLASKSDVESTTANVIGEIPGTDLANEIVCIGGHLDSWDLGVGAVDDGAGVSITAAAAALIVKAGQRPRRTVRVVMYGNEENGFDGARLYGDLYKDVPHQLIAESDFGAGRVWQLKSRVQPAVLPLVEQIGRVLAPLGVAIQAPFNDGGPGPDAAVLMRRHKWPALQLSQDGTAYFDIHHTVNDTLARIEPAAMAQNTACWAVTAWLAAQAPLGFGPAPV